MRDDDRPPNLDLVRALDSDRPDYSFWYALAVDSVMIILLALILWRVW